MSSSATTRFARETARQTARIARIEAKKASAPKSALKIPTRGLDFGSASVAIRQVGCTRRVFLRAPFLTTEEAEGLAYRIHVLSTNEAINSVLIAANDENDNPEVLPESCRDVERRQLDLGEYGFPATHIPRMAGGYDPLQVYKAGIHQDKMAVESLLASIEQLALACRGDTTESRVPVITLSNGLVHDGGYALCMGSYVLATRESRFSIQAPSKGLALDPIGLSYILPRLGWDQQLPCANYPGVGAILALSGYEADTSDMMETGLATNYVESATVLGLLERTLSEIASWKQQGIALREPRLMGEEPPKTDKNAFYRNRAVANTLHAFTTYHVSNRDMWTDGLGNFEGFDEVEDDPSLVSEFTPWEGERESDLVSLAATFADIFRRESSVLGIMESLREAAAKEGDEAKGAATVVQGMERQSPLSLHAVYRLLQLGSKQGETLESCMEREKKVQAKLFGMSDFEKWAAHASKQDSQFPGWSHKRLQDVTQDEVEELFQ